MDMQQLNRCAFSGVLTFLLGVAVPHWALADAQPGADALLEQQLAVVERSLDLSPGGARSVVYLGAVQNAQSPAFHEDVLRVQQRLQAANPKLQSIILSNDARTTQPPFLLPRLTPCARHWLVWQSGQENTH